MNNLTNIQSAVESVLSTQAEAARRKHSAEDAQIQMPKLLSGSSTFSAMKRAVDDIERRAPKDHDVVIHIGDLAVCEARFIEPHTFVFEGFDKNGHRAGMVCHFSQVNVRITYRPKSDDVRVVSRVVQGFAPE